jgi:hypothetical protein
MPAAPRQISPSAGAAITPTTGAVAHQRDIDGVFEPPARNSAVPSSGSTSSIVAGAASCGTDSSETTGTPERRREARKIAACAASSAAVTGDRRLCAVSGRCGSRTAGSAAAARFGHASATVNALHVVVRLPARCSHAPYWQGASAAVYHPATLFQPAESRLRPWRCRCR